MLTHVAPTELEHVWAIAIRHEPFVTPFSSYDWYTTWSTCLAPDFTFTPLRYKDALFPLMQKGSYLTFGGDENVTDFMDAIGTTEHKNEGWQAILEYAQNEHIQSLVLNNVPASSITTSFFRQLPAGKGLTVHIVEEDSTPWMQLPTDWESYVNSLERKDRHELRRKLRKFEREHPEVNFSLSENTDRDMTSLLSLMKNDPAKQHFLTDNMDRFFRRIPQFMKNSARILRLSSGTDIIAAVLYFLENKTLFLYNSGFDETTFSGAGFYIKALSVKHAIETSCTTYNFLQGKERYKYELGAKDSPVFRIQVTFTP